MLATSDELGRKSSNASAPPQRVISLLGAATETLFRLGLGHTLVGRSHECDFPSSILVRVPCVSQPRLEVQHASSHDIDVAVRKLSASNEPVYWLNEDEIAKLQPDLLISQDHCRVCAVTSSDIAAATTCLNIPQLVLRPASLQDCFDDISNIAKAMGVPARGERLLATLDEQMKRLRTVVAQAATSAKDTMNHGKPRVALLEWCDPIMGCGYWIPELVEAAGGTPLHCPPAGGSTPTITFEALVHSKPDIAIFALCGFDVARACQEIQNAWSPEQINQLGELCHDRVYVVDGNFLINRSGPRLVESAEALAEAIWLDLQGHFGHYGTEYLVTLKNAVHMAEQGIHMGSSKVRPSPVIVGNTGTRQSKVQTNHHEEDGTRLSAKAAADSVTVQLAHLRQGDIPAAFAMNSVANQRRWCDPGRFHHVLKTHETFSRLLKEETQVVEPATVRENIAVVNVKLSSNDDNEAAELVWTLVAERSDEQRHLKWKTEKVGF